MRPTLNSVFVILGAGVVGVALLWLPPFILGTYQQGAAVHPGLGYAVLAVEGVGAACLLLAGGYAFWAVLRNTREARHRRRLDDTRPEALSDDQKRAAIEEKRRELEATANREDLPADVREGLRGSLAGLDAKLAAETLEIVAFGTVSSGKSALLNTLAGADVFASDVAGGTTTRRGEVAWPGDGRVLLVDTPGIGEAGGPEREALARSEASGADLILFVVDGPLKDFEFTVLRQLASVGKPLFVCMNKGDWYSDADRDRLRGQVVAQVKGLVPAEDVIVVRTKAAGRVRVRVLPDGTEVEESVAVEPDVSALAARMEARLRSQGKSLLLANVLLRVRGLAGDARDRIQAHLDAEAARVVESYVWAAGGVAALSPFPILDIVAGLAVSSKMVLELARVYGQKVDLATAQRLLGELGKTLLGILGVTAVTPALASLVGSALKTLPGVGTLAGAALQGFGQALLTRWTGAVFIEYFRSGMREPPGGMAALARQKWDELTRPAKLADLAEQARTRVPDPGVRP